MKSIKRCLLAFTRPSMSRRQSILGYLFTLPFTLGLILFVFSPFMKSIMFSLSKIIITGDGYSLEWVGLDNYRYSLLNHTTYIRVCIETIFETLINIPVVILFSLFASLLVNHEFKGRTIVRMILFLPVIMGSGIVLRLEQSDFAMSVLQNTTGSFSAGEVLRNFLMELKMPEIMLNYTLVIIDKIPLIIKSSGIQILVFLAGLQSIPRTLFEAAAVEGSTKWESFWKITLPILSPLMLTNVIYTVIDTFTAPGNKVVMLVRSTAFGGAGYGVSSAMAWIYFMSIMVILGIVSLGARRWIYFNK